MYWQAQPKRSPSVAGERRPGLPGAGWNVGRARWAAGLRLSLPGLVSLRHAAGPATRAADPPRQRSFATAAAAVLYAAADRMMPASASPYRAAGKTSCLARLPGLRARPMRGADT